MDITQHCTIPEALVQISLVRSSISDTGSAYLPDLRMDNNCINDPQNKDVSINARIIRVRRRRRRGIRFTRVKNERAKKAKAKVIKATRSGGSRERVGTPKCIRAKAKNSSISTNTAAYKLKEEREESSDSAIVITRTLRSRTLAIAVQRATKAKRYRSLAPEPSEGLIQAERERDRLPSPLLFEDNPIASAYLSMARPGGQVQDEGNTPRGTNNGGVVSDREVGATSWITMEADELDGNMHPENEDSESQPRSRPMSMDHVGPQEIIMEEQEDQHDHHGTSARISVCQSEININDPASLYIFCASRQEERVNDGRHAGRGHKRTKNMFFDDLRDDTSLSDPPEENSAPLPAIRLYDRRPFVNQALQSHETTIIHDRIHRPENSLYWFSG
ncbi:hypothetical protein ACEPAG_2689 [Sanghuangporus baumii]